MKVKKSLLIISLLIFFLFILSGCSQTPAGADRTDGGDQPSETSDNTKTGDNDDIVMKINGVDISKNQFILMIYDEAVEFRNNAEIPEGLSDDEYEKWVEDFWSIPVDGRKPLDIVKEQAINAARRYAYNTIKCKESGYKLSEEDRVDLEISIMQSLGNEYDEDDPDPYFRSTFGVNKDEYIKFRLDNEMFILNAIEQVKSADIKEEDIQEYYNKYQEYFSDRTVRSIFLSLLDSAGNPVSEEVKRQKNDLAMELLQRINNGEDMNDLVNVYSEDPEKTDNNGIYIVNNDSVYVEEFMDWVMQSQKGDTGIVESSIGYHIVRCEETGGYEGARDEIIKILQIKIYNDTMNDVIKGKEYEPVINENVFNSINSLPGDLDMSEVKG